MADPPFRPQAGVARHHRAQQFVGVQAALDQHRDPAGHGQFHRLRVAIGHPGHKDKVTPWVLGRPGKDDEILIRRAIDDALAALPLAVAGNHMDAMTRLHTPK